MLRRLGIVISTEDIQVAGATRWSVHLDTGESCVYVIFSSGYFLAAEVVHVLLLLKALKAGVLLLDLRH